MMGRITVDTYVDGVKIEPGTPQAVRIALTTLREVQGALLTARQGLALAPEPVRNDWLLEWQTVESALGLLTGKVYRFDQDFARMGIGLAMSEARLRKDIV